MEPQLQQPLTPLRWIVITTAGWFAGFALTLLIIVPMEALHIGNQSMIGMGMGAGVGLLQARLLRKYSISARYWFATSFIGMSIPYVLYDLLATQFKWAPEEVLPVATAFGSLMIGALQYYYLLKPISKKSMSWIVLTCAGWTMAHALLMMVNPNAIKALQLPVFVNVSIVVLCILGGGPILGLFTARSIVSIVSKKAE